ncbi:MAG: hypothetical protein RI964_3100 [Pseudomonadota bacterium]|jgi:hypothetical protein
MLKAILSIALIINASFAVADSVPVKVTQPIPVIVKFEVVTPGMCRLHFEDGAQKEIGCKK